MHKVEFVEFPLDTAKVALVIYKRWSQLGVSHWDYIDQPHYVTPHGVRIGPAASRELAQLLHQYCAFAGQPGRPCRADVQVTASSLQLLEVNMAFVDGWGTSLNLARAAGLPVQAPPFEQCFVQEAPAYMPELELLLRELGGNHRICTEHSSATCQGPACIYGRFDPALDDKLQLARFAPQWRGSQVHIPQFFTHEAGVPWRDIPENVYLKFVDKFGPEAKTARFSVRRGKPSGKAPSLRRWYEQGRLIAQAQVEGLGMGGLPVTPPGSGQPNPGLQIVVMAMGQEHLAGYAQYSYGDIITDDSTHGPVAFS